MPLVLPKDFGGVGFKKKPPSDFRSRSRTVEEILNGADCPLPLEVIPNQLGINLCAVSGVSWTEQEDGQLVCVTIHFLPSNEPPEHPESSEASIKASNQE